MSLTNLQGIADLRLACVLMFYCTCAGDPRCVPPHVRGLPAGAWRPDARHRALLYGYPRAWLAGDAAGSARVRCQVLHAGGQLGPGASPLLSTPVLNTMPAHRPIETIAGRYTALACMLPCLRKDTIRWDGLPHMRHWVSSPGWTRQRLSHCCAMCRGRHIPDLRLGKYADMGQARPVAALISKQGVSLLGCGVAVLAHLLLCGRWATISRCSSSATA